MIEPFCASCASLRQNGSLKPGNLLARREVRYLIMMKTLIRNAHLPLFALLGVALAILLFMPL
jgi:hypothetical protein